MKTVCLGDSITYGYGIDPSACWVSLAQQALGGQWINDGIYGDTALGMLVRLNTQVLPRKPNYVLVMGGYNDILISGSFQQAQSAVMAMVHQCVNAGVRPVVGIPTPLLYDKRNPWLALADMDKALEAQEEYLTWLRSFVKTLHLRCVDFAAAFARQENVHSLYLSDGLHPNAQGHRLMALALVESRIWRKEE